MKETKVHGTGGEQIYKILKENWDCTQKKFIKRGEDLEAFLHDINTVCKKHGISISHEDIEGSFLFEKYDEFYINWLAQGDINYL